MKQLIYKQVRETPFEVCQPEGYRFFFVKTPLKLLAVLGPLAGECGIVAALKSTMKLMLGRRWFYGVVSQGRLLHYGWVTKGLCRFYEVEDDSYVIGPIRTQVEAQGKGVATWALELVMNGLIETGGHVFYIDTSEINISCQRVIEKCGFCERVGAYERPVLHE